MSTVTKKGQVTIPKTLRGRLHVKGRDNLHFELKDNVLISKGKERKSLLGLGGIAKTRKIGTGNERECAKKAVARKISREDLGIGVRGKYYEEYKKGTNLVLLSPDVAAAFPDEDSVNSALRSLMRLAQHAVGLTKRSTRPAKKQAAS